jgi:hypothetical protein
LGQSNGFPRVPVTPQVHQEPVNLYSADYNERHLEHERYDEPPNDGNYDPNYRTQLGNQSMI